MSQIDFSWLQSDTGAKILSSVQQNGKLKNFGLLEKPTLASPFTQYQEVDYKIMLIGKSYSGKTTFVDSLSNKRHNVSSLNPMIPMDKTYCETPGEFFYQSLY